jgi:DNA repair protein RadA/Sms
VPDNLRFLCETDLDTITEILLEEKPELCVIDSIQTMYNASVAAAAGSISQVRETTGVLLRLAKETGITFFIIGHVTKEGTVAGPRVLEHMVDTVLYFEGDRYASYRIIRGVKNRFGSTNEIGVFEMRREGLCEVENPSEYMLSGRPENASGSVVSCAMDGTRAILTEVQALVCKSNFGFPKRQATGTDYNRVSLLMAVLEKRIGIPLSEYDAYVNLAGGIRQSEPAMDLGIAMAILSSFRGMPVGDRTVAFGEIGLSGEVRMVTMADVRVQEAAKLGFTTCILPKSNLKGLKAPAGIEIIGISNLKEAADLIGKR